MPLGPNLKLGVLLCVIAFALAAPILYAGAALVAEEGAPPPAPSEEVPVPAGPVTVTLVAKNILFDKRLIVAAAGSDVTVILDNQDAGVLHNVAFYTNSRATGKIFVGETFPGVATRQFTFKAPSTPGSYFFRCDVHPDTMNGTFRVQ